MDTPSGRPTSFQAPPRASNTTTAPAASAQVGASSTSSSALSTPPAAQPSSPNAAPSASSSRKAQPPTHIPLPGSNAPQNCACCSKPVTGQFVRALGSVYHLDCFTCQDCGRIVAAKFFPVDAPTGPYPLCERDYFKRLNLLCASCGEALRGSYITALEKKFHVEHFTCSVCPTVFGPQDSYYEHEGAVYCHFHYSTRFAVKCTGCQIAILKQFVEINRYDNDEHWHPECYMIHKFWNVKLSVSPSSVKRKISAEPISDAQSPTSPADGTEQSLLQKQNEALEKAKQREAAYLLQESQEDAASLKNKQRWMEEKVYRIWTVLSTFEESAAACISEMLRFVSNGQYLEGVRMAEKFVLHVETLFAATDDINALFRAAGAKDIDHVRESRMLCKKIVNFFSLLSRTHEAGSRHMGVSEDLLSLVTGLAHYLKMLIRIALSGALKLEREHHDQTAVHHFLNRLDRLARNPEAAKATFTMPSASATLEPTEANSASSSSSHPTSPIDRTPVYGYKSLSRAVGTLIGQGEATSDLCEACRCTVEDECARFGTSLRWHLPCLRCCGCERAAGRRKPPKPPAQPPPSADRSPVDAHPPPPPPPPPPAAPEGPEPIKLSQFLLEPRKSSASSHEISNGLQPSNTSSSSTSHRVRPGRIFCTDCAASVRQADFRDGFAHVTRLEQYAFLLCVALNKLYALLKQKGVMQPSSTGQAAIPEGLQEETRSLYETFRDSAEIKRMKSVNLDRKLSATIRTPKKSTVVDSPSGRAGQFSGDQSRDPHAMPRHNSDLAARLQAHQQRPLSPSSPARERARPLGASPGHHSTPSESKPPRPPPLDPQKAAQYGLAPLERPSFNRSLTAVKVIDDDSNNTNNNDTGPSTSKESARSREMQQAADAEGFTMIDLPAREMAREHTAVTQRRRAVSSRTRSPRQPNLLSELSALEYMLVKHAAALMLTAESSPFRDVVHFEDLLELVEMRKANFWSKFFKPQDNKKVKKKGVFGIPLEFLVERGGVESMLGAGAAPLRVPTFVDECISAMKQMDMSVEGVFRKNGNIRRLKDLSDALDRDPSSVNLGDDNPVQLAALLKKFLRELPEPLFPFKMHHMFVASQNIENKESRLRVLHLLCCLLPKAHRDTIEVIFIFLKWVATFSRVDEDSGSKMDMGNLATVICPNILYSKSNNPSTDNSFAAIRTLHELLEHQDRFWTVPAELSAILENPDLFSNPELTSKDILRTCREILVAGKNRGKYNGSVSTTSHAVAQPHHPNVHPPAAQLPMPYDRPNPYGGTASPVGSPHERPQSFQYFAP